MVRTSFAQVGHQRRYMEQEKLFEDEPKEDDGESSMAKSKQKIFEETGIDLRNQEKTEGGRRIWTPEIKAQVLKALDVDQIVTGSWLKEHVGIHSNQIGTWRSEAAGGGTASPHRFRSAASKAKAKKRPNGHDEEEEEEVAGDDEEDIAASKSRIKSHASAIAAAKLAKRKAARAKDHMGHMNPNNLSFQADSVANAIRLLELMRDSEDVSMVSISLSVAE